jgi:hypothetical protein
MQINRVSNPIIILLLTANVRHLLSVSKVIHHPYPQLLFLLIA